MTSILEKMIATIAPHSCIICSNYDNILCSACSHSLPWLDAPICLFCGRLTADWLVCAECSKSAAMDRAFAAALYADEIKKLIYSYKFAHARSACEPLSDILCSSLPYLSNDWLVVPVPTAAAHVRQRGFDHAKLLARRVAAMRGLDYADALERLSGLRQVGKNREERLAQSRNAFKSNERVVKGRRVLLIDDVCTTGATFKASAAALKKSGAIEVWGAAVAWKE